MNLAFIGLNPKSASKELWERSLTAMTANPGAICALSSFPGVREACILASGERLEFYLVHDEGCDSLELVANHLAQHSNYGTGEVLPYLYMADGDDAATHAFNTACRVDSFATEDPSIFDAIRNAKDLLPQKEASCEITRELLSRALLLGERYDSLADLGNNGESLASVALDISHRTFDDLNKREVHILGGGGLAELTAKRLLEGGAARFVVAHRSPQHAAEIARPLKAATRHLEDIEECLARADIALISTSDINLDERKIDRIRRARRGRLLVLFDFLGAPNLETATARIDGAFLYGREDLEALSEINPRQTCSGSRDDKTGELVAAETLSFMSWLQSRLAQSPVIE